MVAYRCICNVVGSRVVQRGVVMEVLFCNVVAISTCKSCVRSLSQRGTSCCDDAVVVHVFRGFLPALRRGKCNVKFCDMYVLLQLMKFYSYRVANNRPFILSFQEKLCVILHVFPMCCSERRGVSEALLHAVFKKHHLDRATLLLPQNNCAIIHVLP